MQHQIPIAELGPHGARMARAVSACVHCGFCLAACPTYKVLGEEMDSPRGRIVLMKQALEGDLRDEDARPFVDRCLGCLACETACPSGVQYRELLVPYRARLESRARPWHERVFRKSLLRILESPTRFRTAYRVGMIVRWMVAKAGGKAKALPYMRGLPYQHALELLPAKMPSPVPLPAFAPAIAPRRARVALLAGCAQQTLRPSINVATVHMLTSNGVDVVIPPGQGCCGALALHSGDEAHGTRLAEHNARVFPRDVDAIITNAAGCGSAMKERNQPATVLDIAEFLDALGLRTTHALPAPMRVAYHDACHLSHGQNIRAAPRRLLQQVCNLLLVEIPEADVCCGSAGLYNLEQPEVARALGGRKAEGIRQTGAELVATGNIGCLTQIEAYLGLPVQHTIEVLDSAIVAASEELRTKN